MIAPKPAREADRLNALRRLAVLDTPPETDFDDITRLLAAICGVPIALVSLIDRDRQWFKSKVGLDATETHRDVAFCSHAILGDELFEVPDAAADPRFCDNALVTGEPKIRFYAGHPLTTPEGFNLGTLCAIDRVPRELTPLQRDALAVLARQVVAQLLLRRRANDLAVQLAERNRIEADLRAEKERFQAFMDHGPAMAFMKNADGRFVYVNEPLTRKFGLSEADWLGKTDADLWGDEIARPLREIDLRVLAGGDVLKQLETVPTPDGSSSHWQSYKFPLTDAGGQRFLAGMAVDVTAEKKAELALRTSEAKFRSTVDRLAEGVFIVDPTTGRYVDANSAVLTMLGYTAAEFFELDPLSLETPGAIAGNLERMRVSLERTGRCDLGRKHLRRKDGTVIPVEVKVSVVPDGGAGLHALIVRDMTEQLEFENRLLESREELEAANAKLWALSATDALTGLQNRRSFDARLNQCYGASRRNGRPLSLLLLDVDHFKSFNDTYGHQAGDDVLRIVARALRDCVRTTDVLARYGGEEFVVILPDTDEDGAVALAERCRRAVAAENWTQRPVTVSIGASTLADATGDAAALVREADEALYRSKESGRNRVLHGSGAVPMLLTRRG